jgi:beta-glucanase (GH16 family)
MLRSRFTIIASLIFIALAAQTLRARADWQLVWSDEFNGTSVNSNNWTFDTGTGPPYPGWGNNELEYYTARPENVFVTNGLLHIVARKESYSGSAYTSAKLKTFGLFSQTYGRFEFSEKLPTGQGYWPALWMMPRDSVYGGWAASGEIDIMENKGSNPTTVGGTIHYGGTYPSNVYSTLTYTLPAGQFVTDFHTYALEWYSNSINWLVDGQLYETRTSWYSSGAPYPAPFNEPFYIIMNLAVGGNYGGNPDTNTVFPGEMLVDYVRVYTATPAPPPSLKFRLPFDEPPGSTVTAGETNSGGAPLVLQMINSAGAPADFHGPSGSGVAGATTGSRALNFSSNTSQPGQPGPLVAATNASLGFGSVSNFVVTMWFKQDSFMSGTIGPRLFLLGAGTPADTGAANSIGFKFQMANQLYFQMGGITASATFATNLPSNQWIFIAAAYDGQDITIYEGSETNTATLITTTPAVTNINLGSSAALYIGNRQDRQRSLDGWLDDVRFYIGAANASFIESIRTQALIPPAITIRGSGTNISLSWPSGTLQSAPDLSGPWQDLPGVISPYSPPIVADQQFYRVRLQ